MLNDQAKQKWTGQLKRNILDLIRIDRLIKWINISLEQDIHEVPNELVKHMILIAAWLING